MRCDLMDFKDFQRETNAGNFKNLYLFYGADEYIKDFCIKLLKEKLIGNQDLYFTSIEKKISLSNLEEICEEMPLFASKKIVLIKSSGFFDSKSSGEDNYSFFLDIPPHTCLIFREDNIDKRTKSYKSFLEGGYAIECQKPDTKTIGKILTKVAMQSNRKITIEAIDTMMLGLGDDLVKLMNELEKLILFTKEGDIIGKEEVLAVCEISISQRIFDLTDALSLGNTDKALKALTYLIDNNEAPQLIIVMIARQFLRLYDSKCILESGGKLQDLVENFGVRDFVARNLINQSRNYTRQNLLERFERALTLDADVKLGLIDINKALEIIATYK